MSEDSLWNALILTVLRVSIRSFPSSYFQVQCDAVFLSLDKVADLVCFSIISPHHLLSP